MTVQSTHFRGGKSYSIKFCLNCHLVPPTSHIEPHASYNDVLWVKINFEETYSLSQKEAKRRQWALKILHKRSCHLYYEKRSLLHDRFQSIVFDVSCYIKSYDFHHCLMSYFPENGPTFLLFVSSHSQNLTLDSQNLLPT